MQQRFQRVAGIKNPDAFVRHALAALEEELRRVALLGLQDWERTRIVSPPLFQSLCSLQRPSWGAWNGLIGSLRKARKESLRDSSAEERSRAETTRLLGQILQVYDSPVPGELKERLTSLFALAESSAPRGLTWGRAITAPIALRNRIAHDNPTDPAWWVQTARALLPLIQTLASDNPLGSIQPAGGKYSSPWFGKQKGQVFAFNGLDKQSQARYVNENGVAVTSEAGGGQVLRSLQALMGKTDLQETEYRKLMGKLAPTDVKGVLLGDFLVGRPVGEGGFAIVHVGRQLSTGRAVAMKLLKDSMPEEAKLRFQQEAAFLARLQHPHIVDALAYGEDSWSPPRAFKLDEDWYTQGFKKSSSVKTFIALEWVEGQTLEELIEANRRPPLRKITQLFMVAAQAMRTVHDAKLIHRDLKPSNLMLTEDGQLKVMDFGIARSDFEDRTLHTQTGQAMGTPAYMSPEQLRAVDADSEVGPVTDVYSLCASFYELYTGRRIYEHDSTPADTVRAQKLSGTLPVRPVAEAEDLPWEIETLLMGGLQPEVSDRIVSMAALAEDLQRVLDDEPIRYRRPSILRRMQLNYRRNRQLFHIAGLSVAVVSVVALVAWGLIVAANSRTQTAEKQREIQEELAESRGVSNSLLTAFREERNGNLDLAQGSLDEVPQDARGWEWFYLDYLINGDVQNVNVSDQVRAATQIQDYGNVVDVAFAPNGQSRVAFKSGANVTLINAATSEVVAEIVSRQPATPIRFSETGDRLFASSAYGIEVFDVLDAAPVIQIPKNQNYQGVVFDAGMRNYAIRTEQGVLLNHQGTGSSAGQPVLKLTGQNIDGMAWSGDGTRFATYRDDGRLQVWDATSGDLVVEMDNVRSTLKNPNSGMLVEFSANQKWVRVGNVIVNVVRKRKSEPVVLPVREGDVRFIPRKNQLFAVTPTRNRVQVFDIEGYEVGSHTEPDGLSATKVIFRPDGKQVALPGGGGLLLIDLPDCQLASKLDRSGASWVAFSHDGSQLVTGYAYEASLFDTSKGQSNRRLDTENMAWNQDQNRGQSSAAKSRSGRFEAKVTLAPRPWRRPLVEGQTGVTDLILTDQTRNQDATLSAADGRVTWIQFSPDESLVAAVFNDNRLVIWKTADGQQVREFPFESDYTVNPGVAFAPDNSKVALGLKSGLTKVWNLVSGDEYTRPAGYGLGSVLEFSPDSRELFTLGGKIYDIESGAMRELEYSSQLSAANPASGNFGTLEFLPDGSRLVTSDGDSLCIMDPQTGREMLKLPMQNIWGTRFSADGRKLLVRLPKEIVVLDAGPEFRLASANSPTPNIALPSEPAANNIPRGQKETFTSAGGDYADPDLGVIYAIPSGIRIRPAELFPAGQIRSLPRGKKRINMSPEIDFVTVFHFYEAVPEFTMETASKLVDVGAAVSFSPLDYNGRVLPLFELESRSNGTKRIFAVVLELNDESYMVHVLGDTDRAPILKEHIQKVLDSIRPLN